DTREFFLLVNQLRERKPNERVVVDYYDSFVLHVGIRLRVSAKLFYYSPE
ncbi:MAG: hypothetical protein ACJASX_002809, partial [Limisphaerales bacterium]